MNQKICCSKDNQTTRILYCTDSLIAGGAEQQLVELVTRLDRQRFELHIICLYGSRAMRRLHFLEVLRSQGIPVTVLDLDWSTKSKAVGVARLVSEIWRLRPHIIQAVNYHSNLLLRLARPFLPGLSLIGCIFVEYSSKQMRYERLSNWLCTVVVYNSNFLREQLQSFAPHKHSVVIPNGIDLARFSRQSELAAPRLERILLMLGRIAKQKAPHLLIEALGLLSGRGLLSASARLWLVGEPEDAETQELVHKAIEHNKLQNIVLQYPATLAPEVYYHKADIVVLTSLREGLPNVVIEAFAAGKPVVISEAANRSGVVIDGINGWVVRTGDVEHLAEVLGKILAMPASVLNAMRSECQESAKAYGVMAMVQSYEQLYELCSARS